MSSNQLIERGPTLLQLRAELLALFGDQLGFYQLPSGDTKPAFWITGGGKGQDRTPPDWQIEGIECILNRRPVRQSLGGVGTIHALRRWTLTLTSYDTSQSLDAIDLLLFRAYPDAQRRPRPSTDDLYEQLTVELPDAVTIQPLPLT
jgi:hypothetical protein